MELWFFLLLLSALWWRRLRGLCKLPDGMEWRWEKLSLALVGRALLSKVLIWLSTDRWDCAPSLLVTWSEVTPPWGLRALLGEWWPPRGFMSRGTFQDCCCQCPVPVVNPCQPMPPQETLPHQLVVLVRSPEWFVQPSSGSYCAQDFVCALQDWSLCYPQSCGSSIIKSADLQVQIPWGFPVPL